MFHCIAGKDRTGILAALTLCLLGFRDEDVVDDYHLSELAEPQAWGWYTRTADRTCAESTGRTSCRPARPMAGFLANLRADHGSVEGYARSIGVTDAHVDAMRAHLLEPWAPSAGQMMRWTQP